MTMTATDRLKNAQASLADERKRRDELCKEVADLNSTMDRRHRESASGDQPYTAKEATADRRRMADLVAEMEGCGHRVKLTEGLISELRIAALPERQAGALAKLDSLNTEALEALDRVREHTRALLEDLKKLKGLEGVYCDTFSRGLQAPHVEIYGRKPAYVLPGPQYKFPLILQNLNTFLRQEVARALTPYGAPALTWREVFTDRPFLSPCPDPNKGGKNER